MGKCRGNNLERWGVTTPVQSLKLVGEVTVPGGFLDEVFYVSTKIRLRINGSFQEEFLCKEMGETCVQSERVRINQIARRANNKDLLVEVLPEWAVVSPVSFLGYLTYAQTYAQMLETLSVVSIYDTPEVIAFAVGAHRIQLMRAVFSSHSVWNLYAEDTYNPHMWRVGTHVISRSP